MGSKYISSFITNVPSVWKRFWPGSPGPQVRRLQCAGIKTTDVRLNTDPLIICFSEILLSNQRASRLAARLLSRGRGPLVPPRRTDEDGEEEEEEGWRGVVVSVPLTVTQQVCRFIKRQRCSVCHHGDDGLAAPHRLHPGLLPGAAAGQSLR